MIFARGEMMVRRTRREVNAYLRKEITTTSLKKLYELSYKVSEIEIKDTYELA